MESSPPIPQDRTSDKFLKGAVSPSAPALAKLASAEDGEMLPHRYGMDRLHLMIQSPFQVFAYWEVTVERIQEALEEFPKEDHGSFHVALKWIEDGQSQLQTLDSGAASEWWFESRPRTRYRAELCLHSEEFGTIALLNSNDVETPSDSMAHIAEDIEEPNEATELLSRLVQLTGLKQDSIQLEEASGSRGETQTGRQIRAEKENYLEPERPKVETIRPTSSFW